MEHTFTGKHVGPYDELDDRRREDEPGNGRRDAHAIHLRLGARAFSIRDLMQAAFVDPFRGGVR